MIMFNLQYVKARITGRNIHISLAIFIVFIALIILFFRVFLGGDHPNVLSDEFAYADEAKALWDHSLPSALTAQTGNWFYLLIMGSSFITNSPPYDMAKILNVLAVVFAGIIFYIVYKNDNKKILTGITIFVCVVTFAGGYARLFMPESMQFAALLLIACIYHRFGLKPSLIRVFQLAAMMAIAGLIKVHMFLLVPCFIIGIGLIIYIHKLKYQDFIKYTLVYLIALLGVVYALQLIIHGHVNINIFGKFYGATAEQSLFQIHNIHKYLYVLKRHVGTLLICFSPVLVLLSFAIIGMTRTNSYINVVRSTLIVLSLGFFGMLFVTTVFTVSVAGQGPYESLNRIHGRYYEHILILIMVISTIFGYEFTKAINAKVRYVAILSATILLIVSWHLTSNIGWQNPNDYMAVFGLYWVPHARFIIFVVSLSALLLMAALPNFAGIITASTLSGLLVFSAFQYDRLILITPPPSVDKAADMIKAMTLGKDSNVVIASASNNADLYRAGFILLKKNVHLEVIPSLNKQTIYCTYKDSKANLYLVISKIEQKCSGFNEIAKFGENKIYERITK